MSLDFSWDGTNVSTKGFTVHNVYKDILAKPQRYLLNPPDKDGATEVEKRFPPRKIRVEGRLTGSSYANLTGTIIPAFSAFMYKDTDVQIIFSDETDRYFNTQLDNIKMRKQESLFRIMDLEFFCADPFSYDTTPTADTQSSVQVDDTTYNVTNDGHYYAYPVVTITFNQAQTHIYLQNNNISGNRFDVSKSFSNTDTLEVDCKNGTIKYNSAHSPAGFGDGGDASADWLMLATGVNELQVGTVDGSIDVDVALTFNKPYLS